MVRVGNRGQYMAPSSGVQKHEVPAEAPRRRAPGGRCGAGNGPETGWREENEQKREGWEVLINFNVKLKET